MVTQHSEVPDQAVWICACAHYGQWRRPAATHLAARLLRLSKQGGGAMEMPHRHKGLHRRRRAGTRRWLCAVLLLTGLGAQANVVITGELPPYSCRWW